MNLNNTDFKLGYLFGSMDTLLRECSRHLTFDDYIYRTNKELDNLGISINDAVFYDLMELYGGDIDEKIIDGIEYLLVGGYDDEYDGLDGIVFIKFGRIELIDIEDFKKLGSH